MTERWLDEAYADYHGWKGWAAGRDAEGEVARAVAELKMAETPPPARLLEIGFGDGAFLKRAKALGYDCAGLERSAAAAEVLRGTGIDARAGGPDAFAGRSFDVVVAFDVFEHIALPDLSDVLRQLGALVEPGGRLLARFPNMASPFGLVNQYGDITHITGLSPGSFAQVARMAGFETVRVANAATILSGGRGVRALLKPLAFATRSVIEFVFSFAYYGKLTPLAPSVVVVMRKVG
jgi:SAM-dependent methyltransferase